MIVNLPYSTIQCMFGVGGREGGGGYIHPSVIVSCPIVCSRFQVGCLKKTLTIV